ncbi:MAG TPA: DNA polymerase III subunit gamma/tau [Leptolyngbyaceae cyanobacterium]
MSYEPLHHKYRPQTFADLVGQEAISTTLTNAINQQKIAPAYLFTGPRGTGKTSSARILAKSLNCIASEVPTFHPCGKCNVCLEITKGSSLDVVEIDAASNTGVDNIRELIERAQFAPVQGRYKVYIIDECHMLSTAAFNALLKTLEEPPKKVIFVLATTDPQRVLPTIISRCQRFDFRRIPLESMVRHLRNIANKENIDINDEALTLVAQIAQGGLRDAESTLDQLSLLSGEVTVEKVWDLVGAVPEKDLMAILLALTEDNIELLLERTRRLMERGREPLIVLQNLASFYRDFLIAKTAPERHDLVALTKPTWLELRQLAKSWQIATILAGQKHLKESEVQLRNTTQPRLWLEVTLLGLLPSANSRQQVETTIQVSQIQPSNHANHAIATPPSNTSQPSIVQPKTTPVAENFQVEVTHQHQNIPSTQPEIIQNNPPISPAIPVNETSEITDAQNREYSNLEQIWQQVINNIEIDGTKSMLRINSCLLSFNGREAVIGSKRKHLFKLIQGASPLIEKAFLTTLRTKVKITFQVVTNDNHASGGGGSSTKAVKQVTVARENIIEEKPSYPVENSHSASSKIAENPQNNLPNQNQTLADSHLSQESTKTDLKYENLAASPSFQDLPTKDAEIVNEERLVEDGAKRLAAFFKGEIVDFSAEFSQIIYANAPEKPKFKNAESKLPDWETEGIDGAEDEEF